MTQLSTVTHVCLFQARTWSSTANVVFVFNDLKRELVVRFLDIGTLIDDNYLYYY